VAEKLSALRTEKYFAERAGQASIPKALAILKRAGVGNPPSKSDTLLCEEADLINYEFAATRLP
jgi:hypothetical protein